jgi:hypothetical protein
MEKDHEAGLADIFPGRDLFAREHQQREQQNVHNACSNMCHGTPVTGSMLLRPRRVVAVTCLYRHEDNQKKT